MICMMVIDGVMLLCDHLHSNFGMYAALRCALLAAAAADLFEKSILFGHDQTWVPSLSPLCPATTPTTVFILLLEQQVASRDNGIVQYSSIVFTKEQFYYVRCKKVELSLLSGSLIFLLSDCTQSCSRFLAGGIFSMSPE